MIYSVGCGLFGIYAGILKPNGEEWKEKTDVTKDAMGAVAQHLLENKGVLKFQHEGKQYVLKVVEEE